MKASEFLRLIDLDEKKIAEILEGNDQDLPLAVKKLFVDFENFGFNYLPYFKKIYSVAYHKEMALLLSHFFLFPAFEQELLAICMALSDDGAVLNAFHALCKKIVPRYANYPMIGSENVLIFSRDKEKIKTYNVLHALMKNEKQDPVAIRSAIMQFMKVALYGDTHLVLDDNPMVADDYFRTTACSFNMRGLRYFKMQRYRLAAERFLQAVELQSQVKSQTLDDKRELSVYHYNVGNAFLKGGENPNSALQAFVTTIDTFHAFTEEIELEDIDVIRLDSYLRKLGEARKLISLIKPESIESVSISPQAALTRAQRKHKKYREKKRAMESVSLIEDSVLTLTSEVAHEVFAEKKISSVGRSALFSSFYPYALFLAQPRGLTMMPTMQLSSLIVTPQAQAVMRALSRKGARSCLMDASLAPFAQGSESWHLHVLTDALPEYLHQFKGYTVFENHQISAVEKIGSVLRVEAFHANNNSPCVIDVVCCDVSQFEIFQNALCALHGNQQGELTDTMGGCINLFERRILWSPAVELRIAEQPLMLLQLLYYIVYESFQFTPEIEMAIIHHASHLVLADQGLGIFLLNTYWGLGRGYDYFRALKQFELWSVIVAWDHFSELKSTQDTLVHMTSLLHQNDETYKATGTPYLRIANAPSAVFQQMPPSLNTLPAQSRVGSLYQSLELSNALLMSGMQHSLGTMEGYTGVLTIAIFQFQTIITDCLMQAPLQDPSARTLLASLFCNQACCFYQLGLWNEALTLFEQAESLTNRMDNPQSQARLINLLSWRNKTNLEAVSAEVALPPATCYSAKPS